MGRRKKTVEAPKARRPTAKRKSKKNNSTGSEKFILFKKEDLPVEAEEKEEILPEDLTVHIDVRFIANGVYSISKYLRKYLYKYHDTGDAFDVLNVSLLVSHKYKGLISEEVYIDILKEYTELLPKVVYNYYKLDTGKKGTKTRYENHLKNQLRELDESVRVYMMLEENSRRRRKRGFKAD